VHLRGARLREVSSPPQIACGGDTDLNIGCCSHSSHVRTLMVFSNDVDEVTDLRGMGNAWRVVICEGIDIPDSPIVLLDND
jgi:hypothetical protein